MPCLLCRATPPAQFERDQHIAFCRRGLFTPLDPGYGSLDSARPWIAYWNLHAMDLMNASVTSAEASLLVSCFYSTPH